MSGHAVGGMPMPHVLVVDDYPGICPVVQMALETLGDFRVSTALTADEALPILDRDQPDLIILDAVMPGMRRSSRGCGGARHPAHPHDG